MVKIRMFFFKETRILVYQYTEWLCCIIGVILEKKDPNEILPLFENLKVVIMLL
jgi:hypothetical protein